MNDYGYLDFVHLMLKAYVVTAAFMFVACTVVSIAKVVQHEFELGTEVGRVIVFQIVAVLMFAAYILIAGLFWGLLNLVNC